MKGAEIIAKIEALVAAGKFFGLSVWPVERGEFQVSLATSAPNNFRIRRADTVTEGLSLVLAMDFVDDETAPGNAAYLMGNATHLVGDAPYLTPRAVDEPEWIAEAHAEFMAAKAAGEEPGIFD